MTNDLAAPQPPAPVTAREAYAMWHLLHSHKNDPLMMPTREQAFLDGYVIGAADAILASSPGFTPEVHQRNTDTEPTIPADVRASRKEVACASHAGGATTDPGREVLAEAQVIAALSFIADYDPGGCPGPTAVEEMKISAREALAAHAKAQDYLQGK